MNVSHYKRLSLHISDQVSVELDAQAQDEARDARKRQKTMNTPIEISNEDLQVQLASIQSQEIGTCVCAASLS
jgi:hypothetical protein